MIKYSNSLCARHGCGKAVPPHWRRNNRSVGMAPVVDSKVKGVCGLGDPVMDILANVSHEFLVNDVTKEPGGCIPVDGPTMDKLIEVTSKHSKLTSGPGGSAANVMKGVANISQGQLLCKFAGMIGDDETGQQYKSKLASEHVEPLLLVSSSGAPSASCLCLVTPDGQRTMRTCLGASLELKSAEQVPSSWHEGIQLLHCEGYCLYRPQLAKQMTQAAREHGAIVSMDLASFEFLPHNSAPTQCLTAMSMQMDAESEEEQIGTLFVRIGTLQGGFWGCEWRRKGWQALLRSKEEQGPFPLCIEGVVSLAHGLPGPGPASKDEKVKAVQDFLLQHVKVSVVSLGPQGCVARSSSGEVGSSPAQKVKVVDTCSAGDMFTSGFLYAYLHGASLERCAAAGCAAGAEAVQVKGANISTPGWERLRSTIQGILQS
ncbi:carbohydrate kinase-like protein [Dunaliella salina]|uniref:Carbohydrate kinase-like protein n=1 Tax=Dunaliella salina TaxID=3046 RepID=A0ABQ7H7H4_DUNSA|nr:carbohydrate kinase-like protein [Dunaliella salina]|eukprot:KAF5842805.1 carbohydrate kinase-like protein [Dunaliella salina]